MIVASATPILLSKDPFYTQPGNISDYQNGEIIRQRYAPTGVRALYIDMKVKNVWQIAFKSEDTFGNPQAAFSTVIEPFNSNPEKNLSYQFAQDSASKDCSPSYSILTGARVDPLYTQSEAVAMEWALKKGWFVNVPNHEGPNAAFGVGPLGGKALLNSIRAILGSGKTTGIGKTAKVALWGYSGGTIPTGWAACLQPTYAADLTENLVGAAVGGWVVNVTATAEAVDGTFFAGLIPNAVNGIMAEFPHLHPYIFKYLLPEKIARFREAKDMCLAPSLARFMKTRFFSGQTPWFRGGFAVLDQPKVQHVIKMISLGLNDHVTAPKFPMYIFHSVNDEVVPYGPAEEAFNRLCRLGAPLVEFVQMRNPDHVFSFIEGALPSMEWVAERLDGKNGVNGCNFRIRAKNQESRGASIPYEKLLETLWALALGKKIGPESGARTDEPRLKAAIREAMEKRVFLKNGHF